MIANKRLWLDTIMNSMNLGTLIKHMHLLYYRSVLFPTLCAYSLLTDIINTKDNTIRVPFSDLLKCKMLQYVNMLSVL